MWLSDAGLLLVNLLYLVLEFESSAKFANSASILRYFNMPVINSLKNLLNVGVC